MDDVVGTVPYISWIPFDLIIPDIEVINLDDVTFNTSLVSNTTMMYIFIYHEDFKAWDLTMATHYTSVTSSTTYLFLDEYGVTHPETHNKIFNVHALYYDNINHAIGFFRENREHKYVSGHPMIDSIPGITEVIEGTEIYLQFQFYPLPAVLY